MKRRQLSAQRGKRQVILNADDLRDLIALAGGLDPAQFPEPWAKAIIGRCALLDQGDMVHIEGD